MDVIREHRGAIGFLILAAGNLAALILIWLVASNTHSTLCAFKADLERRHETLVELLAENPGPFPGASLGFPNVPRSTFLSSAANQQATLDSLADLDCP